MIKNILVSTAVTLAIVCAFAVGLNVHKVTPLQAGAVSSPDILSPYFSYGGVRHWGGHTNMRQATTTVCSFQSPPATTTISAATASFTASASYTTAYEWAWDSTAFSSTTALGATQVFIPANALGVIIASTTSTALAQGDGIIPPSSFINFRLSTTTAGTSATYLPTGACNVLFREVQ